MLSVAQRQRSQCQYVSRIATELSQPEGSVVFHPGSLEARIQLIQEDQVQISKLLESLESKELTSDITKLAVSAKESQEALIRSAKSWGIANEANEASRTEMLRATQQNAEVSCDAMEKMIGSILQYHRTSLGNSKNSIVTLQMAMLSVLAIFLFASFILVFEA